MHRLLFVVAAILAVALFFFGRDEWVPRAHVATPADIPVEKIDVPIIASPTTPTYRVIKVVDGDTVSIDMNGTSVTLRLIGLDTPETVDPRKEVQCYGSEASKKAKELLTGAYVSLEIDASQGTLDKYGRTLAYVYLADGTHFNEYMIREGYGHEYTYSEPYKYQAQFKAAEQEARSAQKGLWSPAACSPVPKIPLDTTPSPSMNTGQYECTKNVYNCTSFKTQAEAQAAFDACGGPSNDVHKMDSDKDRVVCESLP